VLNLEMRRGWAGWLAVLCALVWALGAPVHAAGKSGAKPAKPGKTAVAQRQAKPAKAARSAKATRVARKDGARRAGTTRVVRAAPPPRPSYGMVYGLRETEDPLDLKSSVALVIDQETDEVLFSKNSQAVLPIASITKLMTALVVVESNAPMDQLLDVSQDDVDTEKGSGSRLRVGTALSRAEMLHLALMASENRAAHALGRHHPGGLPAFVAAMNLKARELGMLDTRYVEPTGLSSANQSSAHDLTLLVKAAAQHAIIGDLSTSLETQVAVGKRQLQFRNTNGLVRHPEWDIALQKTGYISEAGRCVVMQAQLAGRTLIMVLLDSAGKYSRIGDAERLRKWLAETNFSAALTPLPAFK
jgi:serine-type D-Ala-D-Ala endopeptidase (penicillin-binding protein 7)